MKLLQLPTVALEQRIKEELESNPALDEGKDEEDDLDIEQEDDFGREEISEAEKEFNFDDYLGDDDTPSYKLNINNHSKDDDEKQVPLSGGATFQELLEAQLTLFNLEDDDHTIALHLIGSLDEAGYLRREIDAIVDDLAFTQNVITDTTHIKKILTIIQHLDPPGVGNDQQRRVFERFGVELELLVRLFEVFAGSFVLPGEMSLEPDIGKAASAARFAEVFLEREEGAIRIEFGRLGVFNQLADVAAR